MILKVGTILKSFNTFIINDHLHLNKMYKLELQKNIQQKFPSPQKDECMMFQR